MARKKNRRVTTHMSRMTSGSWYCLGMLVCIAVATIFNLIAESKCEQATNLIGDKERQIRSLEDAKVREAARWESLKAADKLEERLLRNGMKMTYAQPLQIIRMNSATGKVIPGQRSVAIANQRSRARMTARVK